LKPNRTSTFITSGYQNNNFTPVHTAPLNKTSLSDEALVQKYRASGDASCVQALFERYAHLVFGVCMKYLKNREESKDMVQRIFEKLLNDLSRHEIEKFRPWLFVLSKNACLMELRKWKTSHEKDTDFEQLNRADEPDEEVFMEKEADLHRLEEAMKKLNENQAVCVRLFYLENMSYEQVCAQTGYSMNEVKSHIQNGKRNLKNIMAQHK
jgi:RNA polymerase sigma-70 factor (ECF subfamily)